MAVSKAEVEPLNTPYDEDDDLEYYESYDDDPIVQLLRQNFHDYLGIKHSMTVPELNQLAWDHLDVFYKNCMIPEEDSSDFEFDESKFIYYLEMCFTRLFQDVAILSKMLMPTNLSHNQEFNSFQPAYNHVNIVKLGFNTINNPEINEYPYPKHNGPNCTYSSDSSFRASSEAEFDTVISALERLPEHWHKSLAGFFERTAEFLYGSAEALTASDNQTSQTTDTHIEIDVCM